MKILNYRNSLLAIALMLVIPVALCTAKNKKGKPVSEAISANPLVENQYRDIYPDTWVANDALGRTMPDFQKVGPVKNDQRRIVGHQSFR